MTGALAWQVTKILNNKKIMVSCWLRGDRTGALFSFCPGSPLTCVCSCFSPLTHFVSLIDSTKVSKYHRNILKIDLKTCGNILILRGDKSKEIFFVCCQRL